MIATLEPPADVADDTHTIADLLHELGDISPDRVRMIPSPGTVTFEQFVEISEKRPRGKLYEWVDGTLVEKPVGYYESRLTTFIIHALVEYLMKSNLGTLAAPDGLMRILPHIVRGPDVSYVAWSSLPGGRPPVLEDRVPSIVPDLAIEVLSESNRPAEMARKRREYFTAGVKQVWEIDPVTRSSVVYTAGDRATPIPATGSISGGEILPGFTLSLPAAFNWADGQLPAP